MFDEEVKELLIRVDQNVINITKNGTGDYTVTFTTAFSTANYAAIGAASGNSTFTPVVYIAEDHTPITTTCRVYVGNSSSGLGVDRKYVSLAFFGDQ